MEDTTHTRTHTHTHLQTSIIETRQENTAMMARLERTIVEMARMAIAAIVGEHVAASRMQKAKKIETARPASHRSVERGRR